MEEIEVPMEQVQEHIEHAAHEAHGGGGHGGGHGGGQSHGPGASGANWITWSALLSAFLAVAAAVAALNSGHNANESMIEQIHASDQWSYYQAKGIKAAVLESRLQVLEAMGKERPADAKAKVEAYAEDQKEIQEKAKEKEESSLAHFEVHEVFSKAVTLFQIAIAVTAISILAKRKKFLFVALCFGGVGLFYLVQGFLKSAGHH